MKKKMQSKKENKSLIDKFYELNIKNEKKHFQILMEKYEQYNSINKEENIYKTILDNSTNN